MISLYFTYIKSPTKEFTIISNTPSQYKKLQQFCLSEEKLTLVNEFQYDMTTEHELYSLFSETFNKVQHIRYEGHLVLDTSLDFEIVNDNYLFHTKKYEVLDNLELFLDTHNIAKSYARKQVKFIIEGEREESSREFGYRLFYYKYETDFLTENLFRRNKVCLNTTHIYTAYVTEKIVEIKGLDNNKDKLHIVF